MKAMTTLKIEARGNGFPKIGDRVLVGDDVYEIVEHIGSIHTENHAGNQIYMQAKLVGFYFDLTDEELLQLSMVGCFAELAA